MAKPKDRITDYSPEEQDKMRRFCRICDYSTSENPECSPFGVDFQSRSSLNGFCQYASVYGRLAEIRINLVTMAYDGKPLSRNLKTGLLKKTSPSKNKGPATDPFSS
jgi:hypothetical protein